jgi:hypothetical protein
VSTDEEEKTHLDGVVKVHTNISVILSKSKIQDLIVGLEVVQSVVVRKLHDLPVTWCDGRTGQMGCENQQRRDEIDGMPDSYFPVYPHSYELMFSPRTYSYRLLHVGLL